MVTDIQLRKISDSLVQIAKELDIEESMYKSLEQSYKAIGECLSGDPDLSKYSVEIHPQGSLLLGTAIKPVSEDDDVDVDLVCELRRKNPDWTQKDLKTKVGNRLKSSERYKNMMDEEGRRCWTILYRQNSSNPQDRYHLDILPAVFDGTESAVKAVRSLQPDSNGQIAWDKVAMRLTDNKEWGYDYFKTLSAWPKTNPFGYAAWFHQRCKTVGGREVKMFCESNISPLPKYSTDKMPLQRVVQLLKRHRDMMFDGDEDKPISIIITTLAAKAYKGEEDIATAIKNVVQSMAQYIKTDADGHYVIQNPVNADENFADKWVENPKRQQNFFKWLEKVKADVTTLTSTELTYIQCGRYLQTIFGEKVVNRVLERESSETRNARDNGTLRMSSTGILGTVGATTVKAHTFFGE